MKNIVVLGSTGSIGTQTLEIVDAYPDKLQVVAFAAGSNVEKIEPQIRKYHPKKVVMFDEAAAKALKTKRNKMMEFLRHKEVFNQDNSPSSYAVDAFKLNG